MVNLQKQFTLDKLCFTFSYSIHSSFTFANHAVSCIPYKPNSPTIERWSGSFWKNQYTLRRNYYLMDRPATFLITFHWSIILNPRKLWINEITLLFFISLDRTYNNLLWTLLQDFQPLENMPAMRTNKHSPLVKVKLKSQWLTSSLPEITIKKNVRLTRWRYTILSVFNYEILHPGYLLALILVCW